MLDSLTDLHVPSIKQTDAEAAPVAETVASLVASIVGSDGVLTPRELAAGLSVAEAVASLSDDPAVVRSLTLRALESPPKPLEAVLKDVVKCRANLPEQARRPLLEALLPLLSTQGEQARPMARRIAAALDVTSIDAVMSSGRLPPEMGGLTSLLRRAGNSLSRSPSKLEIAAEIAQFTGDRELNQVLQEGRREREQHLDGAVAAALDRLQATLSELQLPDADHGEKLAIAHSLDRTADELEHQFKARLRAIEKRIAVLRRHVNEDVEALSEDGGEEAEVDLRRMSERRGLLLRNDDRDVRERMITKGLARRHEKLKRRHDEQIQLLRDELSEYRNDYIEAARDAVAPVSLADWRLAIPGPTTGARVKDVLDQSATRTLAGGAVAAAGTAGAIGAGWLAPAAVAGVVAAPVGIVVLSVVAAAGVWKLYANREERLRSEQRNRAEAIRKAARAKVEGAFSGVSAALDEVAEGFREVSLSRIAPLRHDAERIREMCKLQVELRRRITIDGHRRLEQWKNMLLTT